MSWIEVPQAPGAQRARNRAQAQERRGFEIRNAAAAEAELLIYDEIDAWWGVAASDIVAELATVTAPSLRVRVNSPGGSVFEGLAIANALRAHPASVIVQVDGLAASIASVIAMAADRVVMAPQSMLMIHEASGMCMGDAAEMSKMAEVLDLISENIAGAYAAKAGGTVDDWRVAMRLESWYLADEAVKAGLADEVLSGKPDAEPDGDEPEMRAGWDLAAYGYNGPKPPERPKPGPPPAKAETPELAPAAAAPTTLTISLGDAVGEQLLAALRASVKADAPDAEPAAEDAPTAVAEPEPPAVDEPDETPPDEWAAFTAHLTTPEPSAEDVFARLKEALL